MAVARAARWKEEFLIRDAAIDAKCEEASFED